MAAGRRPARRGSRTRARLAAGGVTAAVMGLAGCHMPGTSAAAGQPPAGSPVTVASVPGVGDAPLYIARQEGLFRQAGVTVTIRSYPSAAAELAALRSGQADVAAGDYADFFYAQEQDARAPMVVVADGYDAGPNVMDVLVMPGSRITTAQDLAGKTIGTAPAQLIPQRRPPGWAPYSLDTVAAATVLTDDGVLPTAVRWQPMPASDLIGALRSGSVQAILATEPEIFQAESQLGAQSVLDACSAETVNLPLDGYFAPASFAEKHRSALVAFRSALVQAQADAAEPAPLYAALTHHIGMSRETASLISVGTYPTTLKVDGLQRVADLMSFLGTLHSPLNVAGMVFR
jgi:NitT/TauT family transport system substrate-binding protein